MKTQIFFYSLIMVLIASCQFNGLDKRAGSVFGYRELKHTASFAVKDITKERESRKHGGILSFMFSDASENNILNQLNVIREAWEPEVITFDTTFVGMSENLAPNLKNGSWKFETDVIIPEQGGEGVLFTQGGRFAGIGLFVKNNKLVFHYNVLRKERYQMESSKNISPGKHNLAVSFYYDGGGLGKGAVAELLIDGEKVGQTLLQSTIPYRVDLNETFDLGQDTGTPVCEEYEVPFKFNGHMENMRFHLLDW